MIINPFNQNCEIMKLLIKVKGNSIGLTLMELSIAIAAIGILAGIAIPSYISYQNNAKISSAINQLKMIEFDITDNGIKCGTVKAIYYYFAPV